MCLSCSTPLTSDRVSSRVRLARLARTMLALEHRQFLLQTLRNDLLALQLATQLFALLPFTNNVLSISVVICDPRASLDTGGAFISPKEHLVRDLEFADLLVEVCDLFVHCDVSILRCTGYVRGKDKGAVSVPLVQSVACP